MSKNFVLPLVLFYGFWVRTLRFAWVWGDGLGEDVAWWMGECWRLDRDRVSLLDWVNTLAIFAATVKLYPRFWRLLLPLHRARVEDYFLR